MSPRLDNVEDTVADLLFVAVIIAFFAICLLFVRACDRIIGPDEGKVADELADPIGETAR